MYHISEEIPENLTISQSYFSPSFEFEQCSKPFGIPRGEGGNELAIFSFCSGKVARPSTTTSPSPRFVLLFFRGGQGPSMIFLGMCSESNPFYKMFVIMYLYIYKYRERGRLLILLSYFCILWGHISIINSGIINQKSWDRFGCVY